MRIATLMIVALIAADPAFAYMGPGSGLAFIGSLLALIGALVAGLFGFLWFPVKRLIRTLRSRKEEVD